MSSLGGQWRVIRHYLSLSNMQAEVEKLVQKIKPATPEQWDNLIRKFEKVVSARLTPAAEAEKTAAAATDKVKASTSEETEPKASVQEVSKSPTRQVPESKSKETGAPSMGSEMKELSMESLLQGLRLKKDTTLGKISEPTWKEQKHSVSKSSIHSRTAYVISAVVAAESKESVLTRCERLVEHLHDYPEARDYAIKEGAVRALLRVQHGLDAQEPLARDIHGVVNEVSTEDCAGAGGVLRAAAGPGAKHTGAGRRRHPRHHRHRDVAPPRATHRPPRHRTLRLHRRRQHRRHHCCRARQRRQPGHRPPHVLHAVQGDVREHVATGRRRATGVDPFVLRHGGLGAHVAGQPRGLHAHAVQPEQRAQGTYAGGPGRAGGTRRAGRAGGTRRAGPRGGVQSARVAAGGGVVRGERGVAADSVPVPQLRGGLAPPQRVPGHVARAPVGGRARVGGGAHVLRRVPAGRAAAPGRRHHGQQPGRRGAARGAPAVGRRGRARGGAGVAGHGPGAGRALRLPPHGAARRARAHLLEGQVQQDPRLRHRH
ncbi:unnamed protein product [Spodoptera littoralis]|uniref:Uncharacterized protein n=1 Tax=Spodoptera littoralis TaxID=7109 RepID=A0A9P0I5P0_SPOLI|nr:unnamed protein product [Spodoptera littoralis]